MVRSRNIARIPATVTAVALALMFTPAQSHAANYFMDRVNDFADIFRFRVGVPENGKAGGVKARATFLAQAGVVHYDGYYWGLNRRALGSTHEERTEGGVSFLYGSKHTTEAVYGNAFLRGDTPWSRTEDRRILLNMPYWDDARGDLLGVGAEIATPVGAIDIGVNPSQLFDFLTGWIMIDPFQDDLVKREFQESRPERTIPVDDPNPDYATMKRQMKLDAIDARIERAAMERAGQLESNEREAGEKVEMEELRRETSEAASTPARDVVGDEELTEENMNEVEEAAESIIVPVSESVEEVTD